MLKANCKCPPKSNRVVSYRDKSWTLFSSMHRLDIMTFENYIKDMCPVCIIALIRIKAITLKCMPKKEKLALQDGIHILFRSHRAFVILIKGMTVCST